MPNGDSKADFDVEEGLVYDEGGPVEFAEKAELRLVVSISRTRLHCTMQD